MTLLFDENLSPKLVIALADQFPGSCHVDRVGLGSADDNSVWEYAQQNNLTLVSEDSDFQEKNFAAWLSAKSNLDKTRELHKQTNRNAFAR